MASLAEPNGPISEGLGLAQSPSTIARHAASFFFVFILFNVNIIIINRLFARQDEQEPEPAPPFAGVADDVHRFDGFHSVQRSATPK